MWAKNDEFMRVKFPFINFKIKIYKRKIMWAKMLNLCASNFLL